MRNRTQVVRAGSLPKPNLENLVETGASANRLKSIHGLDPSLSRDNRRREERLAGLRRTIFREKYFDEYETPCDYLS